MIDNIANHLWQSTVVAIAVSLLTMTCRRQQARVRYSLWLVASVKFLLPFALLITIGRELEWPPLAREFAVRVSSTVVEATEPFVGEVTLSSVRVVSPTRGSAAWLPRGLVGLWLGGLAIIVVIRVRLWRRVRAAVAASAPCRLGDVDIPRGVDVRCTPGLLEPGVVGWRSAILLVPRDIAEYLTPCQLEAVLAHELCHIRRRDNLTAAVQMVVEVLFWFHPLVWWIGARLLDERERACDEHVLSVFGEPRTYAEGIVNVCRQYVEARLSCVSGVSGANLKLRIEEIMANRIMEKLNVGRKMLLAAVGIAAVAGPIAVGIGARQVRAQSPERTPAEVPPTFEVASIKPSDVGGNYVEVTPGTMSVHSATLRTCITWAYSVQRSQVTGANATSSRMLDSERYDIVAKSSGPVPIHQLKQMLQQLLADRFTMTLHHERREAQTYALLLDKGGPKFRESTEEGESVERAASKMNRQWTRTRTAQFADQLSEAMEAPVLDETGLTSKYDFALDLTPYLERNGERPDIATMMITAIKEQLGLRLASRRAPVDVFVIDHVEKPSAN